jgi:biotin carboxylase
MMLGGSRYHVKGIQSAQRAGYRVVVADRDPQAAAAQIADVFLPIDFSDAKAIETAARDVGVEGVVPLNDYGVITAACVSAALGLPGLAEDVALRSSRKDLMRQHWLLNQVPCPRFEIVADPTEIAKAVERIGLPCILKPARGVGGASRGVVVVRSRDELSEAVGFAHAFFSDKTTMVEQFVEAEIEHSAEVIVHNGIAYVLAIADKVKSDLPYRVDRNVLYPTRVVGRQLQDLVEAIKQAVLVLGITIGAAHVEIATTKDGFVLFELGARCGGGGTPDPIVPYATGINQILETIRAHLGESPQQLSPDRTRGCNYHFIFAPVGRLRAVHGVEEAMRVQGVLDAAIIARPGDTIKPVRTGLDRAGFVIAGGADREEALARGRMAESCITFDVEPSVVG